MAPSNIHSLAFVYKGWEGFNQSLISALDGLSSEHLAFRSSTEMRTVGEIFWHISAGRVDWFRRLPAPGSAELQKEIEARQAGGAPFDADELAEWLRRTWVMVDATLRQWSVEDLAATYPHGYQGTTYAVSRQWTIWRIMAHDIYHGGQLSELLAMQGVIPLELTILGGHLTVPAIVEPTDNV
ncbi:DinB family protein [Fimbriimonas ginsengisoli]|uniref:DinB-like domain-containing protein n=1 Tax=Fimbriimonas ginsengisoli Gsoil 348 TaxID=661478 RepID=A0A068NQA2_FIMGI|nr:DinB family protein [Fimbriimonas ginsengisoli]AIE85748.1 hypothetical protein OP10G_2380 [Fimbriimonas ginsengisoli Gsoil 348]